MRFFGVNATISILSLSIFLLTLQTIRVQAEEKELASVSATTVTNSAVMDKNKEQYHTSSKKPSLRPRNGPSEHQSSFSRMQRKRRIARKDFGREKNLKQIKNAQIIHKLQEAEQKDTEIHFSKDLHQQEESRRGRKVIDPFYKRNLQESSNSMSSETIPRSQSKNNKITTTEIEVQTGDEVDSTITLENTERKVSATHDVPEENRSPPVVNSDTKLNIVNQAVESSEEFIEKVQEGGLINTMKDMVKEKIEGKRNKKENSPSALPTTSKPKLANEKYNYAEILQLSILFYEAQRSGDLSEDSNRIPWRGDAHLNDGSDIGKDLSGGWYDAGDHIKFTFPMAYSTTVLTWGLLEYWDGYKRSGELEQILDCIKWPLDYLMKANVGNGEFVVQVGDGNTDHSYWGSPENMNSWRPTLLSKKADPGGTEPIAEAAAALAAGFLAFKDEDPIYARDLLENAKDLFNIADTYRATFTLSEPYYKSWSGYNDELAWAAAWLYKATGNREYLRKAEQEYNVCCYNTEGLGFSWDGKAAPVQIMLYKLTRKEKYKQGFEAYMNFWIHKMRYTPKGLAFYSQWGSNRYAANTAFLGLVAADYGIGGSAGDRNHPYRIWSQSQVHYILGDCCGGINPDSGRPYYSYIIGYGDNFPRSPHHRSSSCNKDDWSCGCSDQPNKNILYGAMVGGPGDQDNYNDNCQDYTMNEVATDYNAGITGAVAALKHLAIVNKLPTKSYTPNPSNIIMKVVKDEYKPQGN